MRMSEMTDAYVKLDKVSKIYGTKEVKIVAVDEISFEIAKGEFVVIVGPSGAGKTTVLNILGGMDQATSGEVLVDGRNIARYNSRQLTGYRRNDIGFVFQFYNLVPNLTALENVELALQICKNPLDAREVLEEVGLKVKNLRYYKSQPWSFSGSLLFGFFCDVDGDDTLTVDHEELSMAQWVERDKIPDQGNNISLTKEMMMLFRAGKEPR